MPSRRPVLALVLSVGCVIALGWPRPAAGWRLERPVAPGVVHLFERRNSGPVELNVIRAPRADGALVLSPVLATGIVPQNDSLSNVIADGARDGRLGVAAVNGDYFRMDGEIGAGDPLGILVLQREVVSFPYQSRSALVFARDGAVSIERFRFEATVSGPSRQPHTLHGLNSPLGADQLVLYTSKQGASTGTAPGVMEVSLMPNEELITPNSEITCFVAEVSSGGNMAIAPHTFVLSGHGAESVFLKSLNPADEVRISIRTTPAVSIEHALGGGPRIVRAGKVSVEAAEESFSASFANTRHPRTAVGISQKSIFLVTADGRQSRSQGMTLKELAQFMLSLGCTDALNLDGGGSTSMVVRGRLASSPSGGRERRIADALTLVSAAPAGALASLTLNPDVPALLAGERVPLRLAGRDGYGDSMAVSGRDAQWSLSAGVGEIAPGGTYIATGAISRPTKVTITARVGDRTAQTTVTVYPQPAALEITPGRLVLGPGQTQQFAVTGRDAAGGEIPAALLRATWRCSPGLGSISGTGVFRAAFGAAEGTVSASVGALTAEATVRIVGEDTLDGG